QQLQQYNHEGGSSSPALYEQDPFPLIDSGARNWNEFATVAKKTALLRICAELGRDVLQAHGRKLNRIIDAAVRDEDEWVRSLGRLLEGFPNTNRINPGAVDSELVYKINSDFMDIFQRLEALVHVQTEDVGLLASTEADAPGQGGPTAGAARGSHSISGPAPGGTPVGLSAVVGGAILMKPAPAA
ncbi:unnamed protein product, partial [Amoebophrya sp. A25]